MRKIRLLAGCLTLALLLLLFSGCRTPDADTLHVVVLDVGQSDCILLSQGEQHMLIDTGTATERDAVMAELALRGVDTLEYLVITHPHEDHYGNARILMETYTVKALILCSGLSEELGYRVMLESAAREDVATCSVGSGYKFSFGSALCEVYSAMPDDPNGNNASLVLRVSYKAQVLLFMGDAEAEAESVLLAQSVDWDCDFLKVGHHGSNTSCSAAFLEATTPQVAAISCGLHNEYGFPHREVLTGLEEIGATVYRTDRMGSLHFVCDGRRIVYEE